LEKNTNFSEKKKEILSEGTIDLGGKPAQYCLMSDSLLIYHKPSSPVFGGTVHLFASFSDMAYKKEDTKIKIIYKDSILELTPKNVDDFFDKLSNARAASVKSRILQKHSQAALKVDEKKLREGGGKKG